MPSPGDPSPLDQFDPTGVRTPAGLAARRVRRIVYGNPEAEGASSGGGADDRVPGRTLGGGDAVVPGDVWFDAGVRREIVAAPRGLKSSRQRSAAFKIDPATSLASAAAGDGSPSRRSRTRASRAAALGRRNAGGDGGGVDLFKCRPEDDGGIDGRGMDGRGTDGGGSGGVTPNRIDPMGSPHGARTRKQNQEDHNEAGARSGMAASAGKGARGTTKSAKGAGVAKGEPGAKETAGGAADGVAPDPGTAPTRSMIVGDDDASPGVRMTRPMPRSASALSLLMRGGAAASPLRPPPSPKSPSSRCARVRGAGRATPTTPTRASRPSSAPRMGFSSGNPSPSPREKTHIHAQSPGKAAKPGPSTARAAARGGDRRKGVEPAAKPQSSVSTPRSEGARSVTVVGSAPVIGKGHLARRGRPRSELNALNRAARQNKARGGRATLVAASTRPDRSATGSLDSLEDLLEHGLLENGDGGSSCVGSAPRRGEENAPPHAGRTSSSPEGRPRGRRRDDWSDDAAIQAYMNASPRPSDTAARVPRESRRKGRPSAADGSPARVTVPSSAAAARLLHSGNEADSDITEASARATARDSPREGPLTKIMRSGGGAMRKSPTRTREFTLSSSKRPARG